jgi:serine/threonine-protein kinase
VTVKGGQMTSLNISVPNGRVSINAAPWAEVTIDGTPAGQTPLANLSLPIGTHEVVFRHPQFGERKQTITVKADGMTRVSHSFQDFKN